MKATIFQNWQNIFFLCVCVCVALPTSCRSGGFPAGLCTTCFSGGVTDCGMYMELGGVGPTGDSNVDGPSSG